MDIDIGIWDLSILVHEWEGSKFFNSEQTW